jgi:hypothetical protein
LEVETTRHCFDSTLSTQSILSTESMRTRRNAQVQSECRIDGYPKLSEFISKYYATPIFRRFGDVQMRNLLYYQAEIIRLEEEVNEIAHEDFTSDNASMKEHHMSWLALSSATPGTRNNLQWCKILELRELLHKYSISTLFNW